MLLAERAREKAAMPPEWQVFRMRCLPPGADAEIIEVTGAIAPKKRSGYLNWKKRDKSTERTVYLTLTDHEQWVRDWECETGLCGECRGSKQEWAGWSKTDGHRYRPCGRCGATGKAKSQVEGAS